LNDADSILPLFKNKANAYLTVLERRTTMSEDRKPRLVGINHVAIEVGDIAEALAWYGRIFDFTLRGRGENYAFIDMGDQFINLTLISEDADSNVEKRHLGLVVDDRSRVVDLAKAAGAHLVPGRYLDLLDPWGNRLQVTEYSNIQFTKAPSVLRGMGLELEKNENAKKELAEKGMTD
jgi:lactoylglutathione lyase